MHPTDIDEEPKKRETPRAMALRLAKTKAEAASWWDEVEQHAGVDLSYLNLFDAVVVRRLGSARGRLGHRRRSLADKEGRADLADDEGRLGPEGSISQTSVREL